MSTHAVTHLRTQRALWRELVAWSDRLAHALETGAVDRLRDLIAERGRLLAALAEAESAFRPGGEQADARIESFPPAERLEAAELHSAVVELKAQAERLGELDLEQLRGARTRAGAALGVLRQGRRAAGGYTHAPNAPRLQDTNA